ncbi:Methionine--tRNA ligase [Rickettsiales bacterium Ac37b]|nr:Methionine--tRNA ligase [Rickettsiales bacterium Ac37b]
MHYYITTPIYYVNDAPHVGHAYTSLACDVLARFMRLCGMQVKFMTGTDEHGQKVEKSALNAKVTPKEFVNTVSQKFYELSELLNLSNDGFIRTTDTNHINAVQALWKKLQEEGHIYLGKYSGWYSVRDEAFYSEAELIDGKAPTGAPVEWVEEPSYFFNLSKWSEKLLAYYKKNPDCIQPVSRYNEVVSFVKSGLIDLSISRTSFKWGIPVPGDEKHIIYVWLDALSNYISAVDYPNTNSETFQNYWPADIHMVGKDILRFHAVYWPAFLMAAELPLPKKIVAHGWWTIEGEKMSKSLGNVIAPITLVEEYGLDQTRYFLMREIAFGSDGNYSSSALINRINSELSNNIGNLVQRTLTMIYKNCAGQIPNFVDQELTNTTDLYSNISLLQQAVNAFPIIEQYMRNQQFNDAIEIIIKLSNAANIYIDIAAPWNLAKTDVPKMQQTLYILAETIRYIAILLQPFIPDAANKILDQLSVDTNKRTFKELSSENALQVGKTIRQPEIIFARYGAKQNAS